MMYMLDQKVFAYKILLQSDIPFLVINFYVLMTKKECISVSHVLILIKVRERSLLEFDHYALNHLFSKINDV